MRRARRLGRDGVRLLHRELQAYESGGDDALANTTLTTAALATAALTTAIATTAITATVATTAVPSGWSAPSGHLRARRLRDDC